MKIILILIVIIIMQGDTITTNQEIKVEMLYQEINNTLRESMMMYSKRVKCIIKKLRNIKALEELNHSLYNFTYYNNTNIFYFTNKRGVMKILEPVIDSANFGCTIIGFCAIFLICTVLLIVIVCVACLHK